MALERAGTYRGVYHVLLGRLAPLQGVGPDQLTLDALESRVRSGSVREVILATTPNLEGDGTALLVATRLAESGVPITRLARGLASGSVLEFANKEMLADALSGSAALSNLPAWAHPNPCSPLPRRNVPSSAPRPFRLRCRSGRRRQSVARERGARRRRRKRNGPR